MLNRVLLLCACLIVLPGLSPAQVLPTKHGCVQSSAPLSLSAHVGWLDHPNGMALTTRLSSFNQEFVDRNPLRGTWLEVMAQCSPSDRVGLLISAGMLAPSTTRGAELDTVAGTATEYSLSGTSWGAVEGLVTYSLSNSFQAIGGFRWDHFNTRWNFSAFSSFLDYKLNAYVPLIGVQLDQRFFGGEFVARIVGWPGVLPGQMTQSYVGGPQINIARREVQTPDHGYFMEFFTKYNVTFAGSTSVGVFLRWNSLHVGADEGGYYWQVDNTTGTGLVTEAFHRQSLTIGGSLTLDFALPYFL